jgi:hypothetical protein
MQDGTLIVKNAWNESSLGQSSQSRNLLKSPVAFLFNFGMRLIKVTIALLQTDITYYISLILFSVLGIFTHHFFYLFHLTEIVVRNQTLKNVLYSVTVPWRQILLTFTFMMLCVYGFTIWAFLGMPFAKL